MKLQSGVLAAAAAGTIAVAAWLAGVGDPGGSAGARVATADLSTFHQAVVTRLHSEQLDYRWVVCIPSGQKYAGVRVVRCNVDFGEPHIVAYCSVLRGGRLLTSEDDPAIPCGHDDAGYSAPLVEYR
jgi:hypothetical protein